MVIPSSFSCCKNAIISEEVVVSKAPVGSSANNNLGLDANARAIARPMPEVEPVTSARLQSGGPWQGKQSF